MTTDATPPPPPPPPDGPSARRHNGLVAASYVPLTDVAAPVASHVLTALGRARIAAYLADAPTPVGALRLYVASAERADARTIVASVVRATDGEGNATRPDPLAGVDSDAEFAKLTADWYVDTHHAIREAEKQLTRDDEDWRTRLTPPPTAPPTEIPWLDEDHYVPPVPPPLPRLAAPTVLAIVVLVLSILLLVFGGRLGLATELTFLFGVLGVLLAVGMLVMRLREYRDDDDDGAVL